MLGGHASAPRIDSRGGGRFNANNPVVAAIYLQRGLGAAWATSWLPDKQAQPLVVVVLVLGVARKSASERAGTGTGTQAHRRRHTDTQAQIGTTAVYVPRCDLKVVGAGPSARWWRVCAPTRRLGRRLLPRGVGGGRLAPVHQGGVRRVGAAVHQRTAACRVGVLLASQRLCLRATSAAARARSPGRGHAHAHGRGTRALHLHGHAPVVRSVVGGVGVCARACGWRGGVVVSSWSAAG